MINCFDYSPNLARVRVRGWVGGCSFVRYILTVLLQIAFFILIKYHYGSKKDTKQQKITIIKIFDFSNNIFWPVNTLLALDV